jgi:hypothetical protein
MADILVAFLPPLLLCLIASLFIIPALRKEKRVRELMEKQRALKAKFDDLDRALELKMGRDAYMELGRREELKFKGSKEAEALEKGPGAYMEFRKREERELKRSMEPETVKADTDVDKVVIPNKAGRRSLGIVAVTGIVLAGIVAGLYFYYEHE